MKKSIFFKLIISLFFTNFLIGQSNSYPAFGDVVIRNYSPNLVLQRSENEGGYTSGIQTKLLDGTNSWYFGNLHSYSWIVSTGDYQNPKLTILSSGNVGIGTEYPASRLSIADNSDNQFVASYVGGKLYQNYKFTSINYGESISNYSGNAANIGYMSHQENKALSGLYFTNYGESEFLASLFIKSGGNVGIGTINPSNKLDVNGTIHSKGVKVDITGWSDFVFKKEYNLPTLEEVEKHIVEKGHLENIPSEHEVLKNGINLGEMNAKLLQKIEELTLYVIEMKKENTDLKKRIEKIEKK